MRRWRGLDGGGPAARAPRVALRVRDPGIGVRVVARVLMETIWNYDIYRLNISED